MAHIYADGTDADDSSIYLWLSSHYARACIA